MIELRRGDVVFYGERGEFIGKLRPRIVVQRQSTLADAPSVTIVGLTTVTMPTNGARVAITPSPQNGLDATSYAMVDKIASISRSRVRQIFGNLNRDELTMIDRALRVWLEL